MDTRLADAERIFEIVKRLRDEQRKYERIQARNLDGATPRACQKLHVDLNWQAFHIVKIESELHAACVDAGIADSRDPEHYRPRSVKFDGRHDYLFTPALPACRSALEPAVAA